MMNKDVCAVKQWTKDKKQRYEGKKLEIVYVENRVQFYTAWVWNHSETARDTWPVFLGMRIISCKNDDVETATALLFLKDLEMSFINTTWVSESTR
eukprot:scaffold4695_cov70-Cylindrotheca_fusiformis.AAC.2